MSFPSITPPRQFTQDYSTVGFMVQEEAKRQFGCECAKLQLYTGYGLPQVDPGFFITSKQNEIFFNIYFSADRLTGTDTVPLTFDINVDGINTITVIGEIVARDPPDNIYAVTSEFQYRWFKKASNFNNCQFIQSWGYKVQFAKDIFPPV